MRSKSLLKDPCYGISLYHEDPFSSHFNDALYNLADTYPKEIEIRQIGYSVKGTPLLALIVGKRERAILINGCHHAREAITAPLVLDQARYLLSLAQRRREIGGIKVRQLLKQITFVFVPLVNPDGADLVLNGIKSIEEALPTPYMTEEMLTGWKANFRGVDLNENYPTRYLSIYLTPVPGASGYPGSSFFSEPETSALKALTETFDFAGTLSYHSSGREIYWYYNQKEIQRDLAIAKRIAQLTGYRLLPPTDPCYGSGYKDWFIENYGRPALTLEVAPYIGPCKVPARFYRQIWQENKYVPIFFANMIINC